MAPTPTEITRRPAIQITTKIDMPLAAAINETESHLYEQVAGRVASLIEKGTLRPGEKVPSVRRLSVQQKVSIATVLQAYRILENRGFIEARPRSGYYVRARCLHPPAEPEMSWPG